MRLTPTLSASCKAPGRSLWRLSMQPPEGRGQALGLVAAPPHGSPNLKLKLQQLRHGDVVSLVYFNRLSRARAVYICTLITFEFIAAAATSVDLDLALTVSEIDRSSSCCCDNSAAAGPGASWCAVANYQCQAECRPCRSDSQVCACTRGTWSNLRV